MKYRDREWMYHKYAKEGLSLARIGTLLNTNPTTIRRWLGIHGIKVRNRAGMSTVVSDCYETIYLIRCKHTTFLTFDSSEWCDSCIDWVEGEKAGDVILHWQDNGNIAVSGQGFAEKNNGKDKSDE